MFDPSTDESSENENEHPTTSSNESFSGAISINDESTNDQSDEEDRTLIDNTMDNSSNLNMGDDPNYQPTGTNANSRASTSPVMTRNRAKTFQHFN